MGTVAALEVVGRERELAAVERFLGRADEGPRTLVVEGEAGIGKTTIWSHGVALARERLGWVLCARPTEADTAFAYAGLTDLFEAVLTDTLPQLARPQRRALEVALLRAQGSADPHAVSAAVLNVVRALAALAPVVLAIDDVQWLDPSTARALAFALHRLEGESVLVLASERVTRKRAAVPFGLDRALGDAKTERLPVGPLSVDAVAQILRSRLDRPPARPTLVRIHEACGGNPFYALEIARALAETPDALRAGGELPLPENLRDLVRARLARLPAGTREALLFASALSQPTVDLIEIAAGQRRTEALAKAEASDVILVERGRIRFTHPLLSAALYTQASPGQRRELHRRLAEVVRDPEQRALHLARAAVGPDEEIAAALEIGSDGAHARGASAAAADLAEQAWRLSPTGSGSEKLRRQVKAAERVMYAGDLAGAHRLLDEAIAMLEPSPLRARALAALAVIQQHELADWDSATETLEQALTEVGEDVELRVVTERHLTWQPASGFRALRAQRHAQAAVRSAEELGDPILLAEALAAFAAVEFQRGRGIRLDLIERALELEDLEAHQRIPRQPRWAIGMIFADAGMPDEARECYRLLLRVARDRGEDGAIPWILSLQAALELKAGNPSLAEQIGDQALALALQTDQQGPIGNVDALRAELATLRGPGEQARSLVEKHLGGTDPLDIISCHGLLASLELSLGDAASALPHFPPIHDQEELLGIGDPSIHAFAADEIEALIAVGRLQEAEPLLERLQERGRALDRTWALATAGRCRGLLLTERGDLEGALAAVDHALEEHDRLPIPLERARTLLAKGKIERRAKQKRAARESLRSALEIFDELGAALWAKQTREELARIGGRARANGLTPTEQKIAELVTAGRTNREVAEAMFVSVKTVEANLSRVYRKLGISSRRELARWHARQT